MRHNASIGLAFLALGMGCSRSMPAAPPAPEIRTANDARMRAWFDGDPGATRVLALLSTT